MKPEIRIIEEKKLVGLYQKMSLADDKTALLWRTFAPNIKYIKNRVSSNKISLQVYDEAYHSNFDPKNTFEKWALVEVEDFDNIPDRMHSFVLKRGKYAVFYYQGSSKDKSIFQYIFTKWLPHSEYMLDDRPHFEVLGKKYKNNDPTSEEEIWIPIR